MDQGLFSRGGIGRLLLVVPLGVALMAQGAAAAGSWSTLGIAVPPVHGGAVVEATDALLASETGKQFPGRLLLLLHEADGADPSSHSFVPIYRSGAERESFLKKLRADPAYAEFQARMAELGQGTTTASYRVMRSWGNISDDDVVWTVYAFAVSNPAAFVAASESFMASATGKQFPGQLHLSSVVAAGFGAPTSHVLSVGFASEAEFEAWGDRVAANPEWQTYLAALNASSEYLGAQRNRTIKAWGKASLKKLVTP